MRASESGHPIRFWVQDLDGSPPRAITEEGVVGVTVAIKGTDYVCAKSADGHVRLFSAVGGQPRDISGVLKSDLILAGSSLGDYVFVIPDSSASEIAASANLKSPLQVSKVNIVTGQRESVLNLSPSNPTGTVFTFPPILTSDEKHFVYTQARVLSTLYTASGMK